MRCDELPAGVDYATFDYGVNSGIGRSGKVLRRVLKLSDSTSSVTDEVIDAASRADALTLVKSICTERLAFLKSLKTFPVFERGWTTRVSGVLAVASMMASAQRPQLPVPKQIVPSPGKAEVIASKPATQATAGAVVAAGAAAATTGRVEIVLLVAGAAALAALAIFLIWRWRHRAAQEAAVKGTANGLG